MNHSKGLAQGLILLFFLIFLACSTPSQKKELTRAEKIRFEQQFGDGLAEVFEAGLTFENDPLVLNYLISVGERLFKSVVREGNISLFIKLVKNQKKIYWNASLPGNRIYLSLALLKNFKHENELAASIAIEIAHVLKKLVIKKIHSTKELSSSSQTVDFKEINYSNKKGIFAWSESEDFESTSYALGILYQAGFDPRGLVQYYEHLKSLNEHSSYSNEQIDTLIHFARKEIVKSPPLLNPIVSSNDFDKIIKRIKDL